MNSIAGSKKRVNRLLRALREPAFPRITMEEIHDRIKERMGAMSGEVQTVPLGITVHCAVCSEKLEPGSKCYIEDDSSSILCLCCASKRQTSATKVGPTEFKLPKITDAQAHKAAEWMQYD